MGDDGFYVGLGYASSQREEQSLVAQGDENATDTPKNPADTLIQAYLQQCLDFHEVQEDNRRGQVNNQKLPEPQQNPVAAHVSTASATSNDEPRQRNQQEQAKEIQEAQSRAQAILKRFEQQQQKLLGNSKNGVLQDDLPVSSNAISETSSNDFEKRRRACFEREAQRRHAALLKNLEYVANKQSTRMNELAALQKQTAEWEGRLDNHYTAVLEERKRLRKQAEMAKLCQVQQAGVGTKRRKTVDKQLERTGHAPSRQGQQQEQYATTVAVYVSGMPVNDKASFGEDTIRNLFCSYGKIQKIHFYRNKKTGELKGDGLIIYEKVGENNADVLLQTVCSQVRLSVMLWIASGLKFSLLLNVIFRSSGLSCWLSFRLDWCFFKVGLLIFSFAVKLC